MVDNQLSCLFTSYLDHNELKTCEANLDLLALLI